MLNVIIFYREIFGGEGSAVVKRLHDSDSDDEDKTRQKVLKPSTTTSNNATDILTSNSVSNFSLFPILNCFQLF